MKSSLRMSNQVGFWGLMSGVLAIAGLLGLGSQATAVPPQDLVFTGTGGGVITSPGNFAFGGTINGTPLGPMTFEGTSFLTGPDPKIPGNDLAAGTITFTAPNGDELYATVVGTANGRAGIFD